jgi:hypothetical protein
LKNEAAERTRKGVVNIRIPQFELGTIPIEGDQQREGREEIHQE